MNHVIGFPILSIGIMLESTKSFDNMVGSEDIIISSILFYKIPKISH